MGSLCGKLVEALLPVEVPPRQWEHSRPMKQSPAQRRFRAVRAKNLVSGKAVNAQPVLLSESLHNGLRSSFQFHSSSSHPIQPFLASTSSLNRV